MSQEPSYPLHWPTGWPRKKSTLRAKFGERGKGVSLSAALDALESELSRLNASHWVVSTNIRTRLDGRPYGNQARPADVGIAVYFTLDQRRTVLACDKWDRPEDNLWAIVKHIDALRGQQRWGVGSIEQAFAGYSALVHRTGPSCWEILEIPETSSQAEIGKRFHKLAFDAHPDRGGDVNKWAELTQARDTAVQIAKGAGR